MKLGVNDFMYHMPEGLPAIRVFLAALRAILCLGWQRIVAIVTIAIGICRLFCHDGVKIRCISDVGYMFLKISYSGGASFLARVIFGITDFTDDTDFHGSFQNHGFSDCK